MINPAEEEKKEVRKKGFLKMQEILPYRNIEMTIKQLSSDDIEARVKALKEIKNFGSISSLKFFVYLFY